MASCHVVDGDASLTAEHLGVILPAASQESSPIDIAPLLATVGMPSPLSCVVWPGCRAASLLGSARATVIFLFSKWVWAAPFARLPSKPLCAIAFERHPQLLLQVVVRFWADRVLLHLALALAIRGLKAAVTLNSWPSSSSARPPTRLLPLFS